MTAYPGILSYDWLWSPSPWYSISSFWFETLYKSTLDPQYPGSGECLMLLIHERKFAQGLTHLLPSLLLCLIPLPRVCVLATMTNKRKKGGFSLLLDIWSVTQDVSPSCTWIKHNHRTDWGKTEKFMSFSSLPIWANFWFCLSSIYLSIIYIYLSIYHLSFIYIYPSIYLSIYLSLYSFPPSFLDFLGHLHCKFCI
jgi:hypothetical protein